MRVCVCVCVCVGLCLCLCVATAKFPTAELALSLSALLHTVKRSRLSSVRGGVPAAADALRSVPAAPAELRRQDLPPAVPAGESRV